ncbi:MAG: hypothetical protein GY816_01125 [Cytophagales bacterium]|nr:hypothetical protein [Cytophagales bacterium]
MKLQNVPISVLLSVFFVSCVSNSFDERLAGSIEVEGNSYEVYLLGNDSLETSGFFYLKRIELRENSNASPYLVIDSLDHPAFGEYVSLDDRNFDGHPDISIQSDEPDYQWNPYSLWLYDADQKKFNYNSFLEDAPEETYWIDEAKQIMIPYFDRGETRTNSFYAFEDRDFVLVEEEITVDGSLTMGFEVTTISKRVGGKMKVVNTITSAGGLELKRSGTLTDKDDIKSFLEIFGDDALFQPIIKEGSSLTQYHDSCEKAGFTLGLAASEDWETPYELFYPVLDWEEMYEGPDEMSAIEKINYRSSGNNFTLTLKFLEEYYDDEIEDYNYNLRDDTETLTANFDSENYRWVFRYNTEYHQSYFMHTDQADNLPMDEDECEGYGEDY